MDKAVIAILGKDRPGIVAAVSKVLFEQDCNIERLRDACQWVGNTTIEHNYEFPSTFIKKGIDDSMVL